MNIIAIGAHADDIEIACGGTIARAVQQGHKVKMVVMTDSTYNDFHGTQLRTKEEVDTEAKAAADRLGVEDIVVLDFPTKDIPYDSTTVEAIDRLINEFGAELIFTHWTFDTHQAHRNTSLATISAARNFNNILMYEPFPPSGRSYVAFRPQMYIDISQTIDQKIESVRAHTSQLDRYGENWPDSIEGRARMRGFECGVKHAEVFEIVRYKLDL